MAQADQVGIIGKGIVIRGNLTGGGNLVIEGSSRVAISASAKVAGDIKAPRVVIEDGAVFNGSIEMDVKLPEDI